MHRNVRNDDDVRIAVVGIDSFATTMIAENPRAADLHPPPQPPASPARIIIVIIPEQQQRRPTSNELPRRGE
jgi:hypothetical protein